MDNPGTLAAPVAVLSPHLFLPARHCQVCGKRCINFNPISWRILNILKSNIHTYRLNNLKIKYIDIIYNKWHYILYYIILYYIILYYIILYFDYIFIILYIYIYIQTSWNSHNKLFGLNIPTKHHKARKAATQPLHKNNAFPASTWFQILESHPQSCAVLSAGVKLWEQNCSLSSSARKQP